MVGQRIGPYEIVAKVGEGGIGQVYRARDTKLHRDVALKIVPAAFASDAERLARFTREAQTLAALNHPNIAHVHGLDESGGVRALIMEFADGEDLAERIARGPVALDEALPIARQIADALAAAHEQGIVHRDLKPANIKVRADGTVKVLDFGLAKALAPASDASSPSEASRLAALTNSPTLTSPALMTGAGVILGTAAYMAPEQARGKPVDKRADIWAFGCVLYEMLTGIRPFIAPEVSDTLALILTKDVDWTALPASTPAPVRRLLRRCLEKDRGRRLSDMADARLDIEEALAPGTGPENTTTARIGASRGRVRDARAAWAVAVGALGVAAIAVFWRSPAGPTPASAPAVRIRVELGINRPLKYPPRDLAIAPDGSRVAFVAGAASALAELSKAAGEDETPRLYVRPLNQLQAAAIPGTDNAVRPFFSPDGQWVAFFADRKLKKVSAAGGAVVTLCDAPGAGGGWWKRDGTIVFQARTALGDSDSLSQISESGGVATPFLHTQGQASLREPQVLPGARGVLATSPVTALSFDDANIVVVSIPSGERKTIQRGYRAQYLPTGHLTYIHDRTLFAQPFDLDKLAVSGPAVPVVQGLRTDPLGGSAEYSVSDRGTLVYLTGPATSVAGRPEYWLDRTGRTSTLVAQARKWGLPRFSPDGRRIAFSVMDDDQQQADIWVYEWERDSMVRLTRTPDPEVEPIWSPDGRWIAYGSIATEGTDLVANLFARRSDGSGDAIRLTKTSVSQIPDAWHPSGKLIAFHQGSPATGQQAIWTMPVDVVGDTLKAGSSPSVLVKGPFLASTASFSPDGRWLAYVTNESGVFDVYVQPFPGSGTRVQISSGGGNDPRWDANRHELVFRTLQPPMQLREVPYTVAGGAFQAARASAWSDTGIDHPPFSLFGIAYDLHPDGNRVVVSLPTSGPAAVDDDDAVVVFNFFDELRRLASTKQ